MTFLSINLQDTPGLAPRMNVSFWGLGDFPVSYSNKDTSRNAWNRHSGSLWSIWGSYSVIWSLPFTNVKWHSDPWPTVISQPIRLFTNFMTLIPSLTFIELWVVSMEHLQRVWYASRGTLTLPDTWFRPPFWDVLVFQLLLRPDSSKYPCLYSTLHLEHPLVLSRFCLPNIPVNLKITRAITELVCWCTFVFNRMPLEMTIEVQGLHS